VTAISGVDEQGLGKHAENAVTAVLGMFNAILKGDCMRGIIMVDAKTRIRKMDKLNWTVERRFARKGLEVWECANGAGRGPYAGRPDSPVIVSWLLDNAPELDGFEGTLGEYAAAVSRAGKRIAKSIAEMNGEVD